MNDDRNGEVQNDLEREDEIDTKYYDDDYLYVYDNKDYEENLLLLL